MNKDDRSNLSVTLHKINIAFFNINEVVNASYEIAGLFYDLGFHQEALDVFNKMTLSSGNEADIFYNKILCYYQLRQDKLFISTLVEAKLAFPNFEK